MSKLIFVICFFCLCCFGISQNNFPDLLKLNGFTYKDKNNALVNYNVAKPEKKIFLFYNIQSESLAEVMYNGAKFVFDKEHSAIFPIFFSGQLIKKSSKDFESEIPTQLYSVPVKSIFKNFNLTETDFPLIVVYDEQNNFCGFTKKTEDISEVSCDGTALRSRFLKLKILTEEKNKAHVPYANKAVFILSGTNFDTIAKLVTDKFGDFNTQLPNLNQDYIINVKEKNKNSKFVVLASQSGRKIGKFKASQRGFEFKLLQADISRLQLTDEDEDSDLKFTQIMEKAPANFVITETLFYELGQSYFSFSSKKILNKIKDVLDLYPQFTLLVISHTDAQGDDETNLELSAKRSQNVVNYLITKGATISRLKAEGKGEKEIRNRCFNDVDCSNKEHEYNRRTEFKFTKK